MNSFKTLSEPSARLGRPARRGQGFSLTLRLALRELRGGLSGFGVFLGCIALGVAAITAVGSTSRSLSDGLARESRVILGGDVSLDLVQREASVGERAFLSAAGPTSAVTLLRAMARRATASGEATMVEIKAVDGAYPLAGAALLDPPGPLAAALAQSDGLYGVAVDAALPARLGASLGDEIRIGEGRFRLAAILVKEPDQLAGGVSFGPRVLMSRRGLEATGLVRPGALVHFVYRVLLEKAVRPVEPPAEFVARLRAEFPDAGWEARTREAISPQFSRNLERFTQFLTLVGLSSLIVGGVGVANAARAHVARKRATIATLKSLGAGGSRVFAVMLTEALLLAGLGAAAGAALGALAPFVAVAAFGAQLPFPLAPAIHPGAMLEGAAYGLLTALAFSALPLGRAHDVPAQAVFRGDVDGDPGWPRPRYVALAAGAGAALIGLALILSQDVKLTLIYLGASLAAFALLRGVAFLIMRAARLAPRAGPLALRLAVANVHRPGALTPSVVLSLGLGLSLLVALALIDHAIRSELRETAGAEATPSFFFLDVPRAEVEAFSDFIRARAPDGKLALVPMLRGRIVRVNGVPSERVTPKESAAWALQGDRGLTFSETLPEGSALLRGEWWPKDYTGPPLISLESGIAEGLGLDVGDTLSVNALGRVLTGRIASIRKVAWRRLNLNFVLVFSPNAFAGAPYAELATLTLPGGGETTRETALARDVAREFPAIASLRVKDALEAAGALVDKLAAAVRGAASVAILAAAMALAGALAAGRQGRIREAVILKTLGATRGRLLAAFLCEYAIIGGATALFGVVAGSAAAYGVATRVMTIEFVFSWPLAFAAAGGALGFTVLISLAATWRALGRKPAPYLRDL